jgi:tetratricopeptide (TPR) repeat protein
MRSDRTPSSRVFKGMRLFGTLGLALALASAPACGGSKKGKTTPAAGDKSGTDAKGMQDSDPSGDGVPTTPAGGSGAGSGSGSGDVQLPVATGDGGGDDGPTDQPEVEAPPAKPILPPNYDISPDQAKSEVQRRLGAARAMLSANPADSDGAIREARAALTADGNSVDAIVVIAHANYHKRLYDTAEVILDDLLKNRATSQSNPYLYYVYGLVYDKLGERQKAFMAYRKATELDGNYVAALINLGVYQLTNKQYGDATRTYERLTGQLARNDAPTWNGLGSAYRGMAADYDPGSAERNGWLLKAETAFKRAQTADRNYSAAYYNLGLLYLDADPFPTDGGPLDNLVRLQKARTYFEEYKNLPGVDISLYDERTKDVTKLIKREEKKRKKATSAGG